MCIGHMFLDVCCLNLNLCQKHLSRTSSQKQRNPPQTDGATRVGAISKMKLTWCAPSSHIGSLLEGFWSRPTAKPLSACNRCRLCPPAPVYLLHLHLKSWWAFATISNVVPSSLSCISPQGSCSEFSPAAIHAQNAPAALPCCLNFSVPRRARGCWAAGVSDIHDLPVEDVQSIAQ